MIQQISAPENTVAFRAIGEVTAEDYKMVIAPAVTALAEQINEINFLFLIDTELENFKASAWLEDALIGLKNLGKWNRAAIVTDSEKAITFTNGFSYIVPGEFRGYKKEKFQEALNWVHGSEILNNDTKQNEPYIDPDDLGEEDLSNGYSDSDDIDYNYKE
ncbi:STAS/SEC14 domain-containing protein [Flavobacterium sp. KJJ]|uniref:STAS/SEC14 domain-containing protein n=1 Tax=Flavobacterium sp. KJJ TaxID=1270193 RepID=UPI0009EC36E4